MPVVDYEPDCTTRRMLHPPGFLEWKVLTHSAGIALSLSLFLILAEPVTGAVSARAISCCWRSGLFWCSQPRAPRRGAVQILDLRGLSLFVQGKQWVDCHGSD